VDVAWRILRPVLAVSICCKRQGRGLIRRCTVGELVTDGGQVIRIPVDDIRIASRNTQGVRLFDVAGDEHVVSVARLAGAAEANGEEPEEPSDGPAQDGGDGPAAEPDAP
jgi:DNA gyrase C-terminal domain, beta-propeller